MTELALFPRKRCENCETFCNLGVKVGLPDAFFLPSAGSRRILQMARPERVSAPPPALPFFAWITTIIQVNCLCVYKVAMRYRLAQVVVMTATFLLMGVRHLCAQGSPEIQAARVCPSSPDAHDSQFSGPEVSIVGVTFSGFLQMPVSDQNEIATSIKERTYQISVEQATDELLEIARSEWQNRGYFKAAVNGYATTLDSTAVGRRIALSVHVSEGLQYSLGGITFSHNRAVGDAEALRRLFPIKDGEIFGKDKIGIGLQNLSKAYGQLGYINFTSIPDTKFDDEQKSIYLDIDMDEGKQFYVGSINLTGLDEATRQELLKDLPIAQGQIFNSRLWELFLLKLGRSEADCGCADRQVRALDERASTVTLTFDFRPCSGDQ